MASCPPTPEIFPPPAELLNVRSAALLLLFLGVSAFAQTPGDADLNTSYKALATKDYDTAISFFRKGLTAQPQNARAHKDLAYTLLKTGENAGARDEFERALRLDPKDETAALEFAFLAYETKKPIEARRMFDTLRHSANPNTRATAEQAFQNVDKPLADNIARWQEALRRAPDPNALSTFSAHWELAQTAELRDDLPLAAEQFEICRKLKPQLPELLVILGRVWAAQGRPKKPTPPYSLLRARKIRAPPSKPCRSLAPAIHIPMNFSPPSSSIRQMSRCAKSSPISISRCTSSPRPSSSSNTSWRSMPTTPPFAINSTLCAD